MFNDSMYWEKEFLKKFLLPCQSGDEFFILLVVNWIVVIPILRNQNAWSFKTMYIDSYHIFHDKSIFRSGRTYVHHMWIYTVLVRVGAYTDSGLDILLWNNAQLSKQPDEHELFARNK